MFVQLLTRGGGDGGSKTLTWLLTLKRVGGAFWSDETDDKDQELIGFRRPGINEGPALEAVYLKESHPIFSGSIQSVCRVCLTKGERFVK